MDYLTTLQTRTKFLIIAFIIVLVTIPVCAQQSQSKNTQETDRRVDNYLKLMKLGYSEREIFEDLGNANFLSGNYETAVFWYDKLLDIVPSDALSPGFYERYEVALGNGKAPESNGLKRNWVASVRKDYQLRKSPGQSRIPQESMAMHSLHNPNQNNRSSQSVMSKDISDAAEMLAYQPPLSVTADGKVAYFSKKVMVKPQYGIFSKKQEVQRIYRAEKIDGEWSNIREIAVCPKYYSATHPAVSGDGTRLFFASNMPGTFGEYDIYVSEIQGDGTYGVAKNLGSKVNTEKNDLYPNLVNGTLLFFASDGREGYGGLDLYATQVVQKRVGLAVNLGSPFNSTNDEYSIALLADQGMGYVMSNRGQDKGSVQQLAFSYHGSGLDASAEKKPYEFKDIFKADLNPGYSHTIFEDQ